MLTSKQRAYLMSLANDLNPVLQIGKSGVTPETVASAEEVFNRRELFKGSVLKNCPDLPEVAADKLASRVHAQLVKVIGRKFILYRPFKEDAKIELPR